MQTQTQNIFFFFREAANALSTIQGCPKDQLEALASMSQAPDAFGPLSGWTSSQVKLVGCIINGLQPSDIPGIPPIGFEALIPDSMFCFSIETLKVQSNSCCFWRQFSLDVGHKVVPLNYSRCDTKHRLPCTIKGILRLKTTELS